MKKLMYMGITAVMTLTIAGCSKSLKVEPVKQLTVEYGDKLDNAKLFDSKKSDEGIKVFKVDGFDSKKLGSEKVKVTFASKDDKTKVEKEIMIDVKDTKAPVITFDKTEVSVEQDKSIDLTKNVKSVKDPVDGDIKYNKNKVDKDGYYFDEGKLDTKKPGTYKVKVIAFDKNGNKAENTFEVTVNKKAEKETEKAPNKENSGNINKGTSSGTTHGGTKTPASQGQSNGGGNTPSKQPSQQNKPSKPAACVSNGQFSPIGNTGKVFYSFEEMRAWEQSVWFDENSPYYLKGFNEWTVRDNCGERNDVWTADAY